MTDAQDPQVAEILERHLPSLRAFVRVRTNRKLRELESSSDLVQSVCRELLEHEGFRFQGEAQLRGWLYTTALRKIVQRHRHHHYQKRDVDRLVRAEGHGEDGDRDLFDHYATVTTPSACVSTKEQLAAIEEAFDELTEEQREVLSLARIAGLSHAEIAAQTGRSEEASRQLLRRALIRLSIVLEERGI